MCENSINGLIKECLECGKEFIPDESGQECCSNACDAVYYDWFDYGDGFDYIDDAEYYGTDWG